MPIDPVKRRAAIIATAVTVPFVLLVTLVLVALGAGSGSPAQKTSTSGPLSAINVATPPNATAQQANCAKALAQLPVSLGKLAPRIVHAVSVVAWGDPAVVFSCGAARPKDLVPGSSAQFRTSGAKDSPAYDLVQSNGMSTYTTVDRAPYISIVFPKGVQPADYLPALSAAIAAALPAVCSTLSSADPDTLCTRRE